MLLIVIQNPHYITQSIDSSTLAKEKFHTLNLVTSAGYVEWCFIELRNI